MFKRVLIVNPFGIGDALFITPVIRAFREQGAKKIDLIVGKRTKELFETHPNVNQIFVFDREKIKKKSWMIQISDLFKFSSQLRKNQYDLLFDISFAWQYVVLGFLSGIPRRAGFNYKGRGRLLTDRIDLPLGYSQKHVVDYYAELLSLLHISINSKELELNLVSDDFQKADSLLQQVGVKQKENFISVACGGGESWGVHARLKRWPVSSFAELIGRLKSNSEIDFQKVILLGGPSEFDLSEQLARQNPDLIVNLCGKADIRTSAALLSKSLALIANDGGLVHLASSVKTPVVALFGPVDPKIYGPFPSARTRLAVVNEGPECRPCYQNMRYNSLCEHIKCLTELSPERVLNEMTRTHFWQNVQKKDLAL